MCVCMYVPWCIVLIESGNRIEYDTHARVHGWVGRGDRSIWGGGGILFGFIF